MKDEIKEILNGIKNSVDDYVEIFNCKQDDIIYDETNYSSRQWHLLLNYITNLQEENEKLKNKIKYVSDKLVNYINADTVITNEYFEDIIRTIEKDEKNTNRN